MNRRSLITGIGATLFVGALPLTAALAEPQKSEKKAAANEDLMQEHGVLQRILLVYRLTAMQLRRDPANVNPNPLHDAATLFRQFGENYHEKMLEEKYVFPALAKANAQMASTVEILKSQHDRARDLTSYILDATSRTITSDNAPALANVFDNFALMYEEHAAREDTVVFPAWKKILSGHDYSAMGEKFEKIEHDLFGENGFEKAVSKISAIEQRLGFADLSAFTAPKARQ